MAELVCERIAIVDAQPDRSENCRRVLQEAGYPCVATADAEAAAVLARVEPPDLFLAGLEGSSAEALALLERTLCAAGDVPLIAMLTPARLPQGAQFLHRVLSISSPGRCPPSSLSVRYNVLCAIGSLSLKINAYACNWTACLDLSSSPAIATRCRRSWN